jgi:hypothetical protein
MVNGQIAGRIDHIANNAYWGYLSGGTYNPQFGLDNTAVGSISLYRNDSGQDNTAIGNGSLYGNVSGFQNTAVGSDALSDNITGHNLTAVGFETQIQTNDGIFNSTAIGSYAVLTASNQVVLGSSGVTSIGGYANWTNFSDGRYKRNIKQNVPGLAFINQLKPITYTLDISAINSKLHINASERKGPGKTLSKPAWEETAINESSNIIHTGFIAQDVEKTAQKLGYEFSGVDKPKDDSKSFYGLRYGDFVVPLVKAVQELSLKNDSLVDLISQLTDRLDKMERILGINNNGLNSNSVLLSSAKLYQNSPNPFNQTTLINYYVPESSGSAVIQVIDMNGKMIKSVSLNSKGNGQLTLETSQLTAGAYTYSLFIDGNLIDTKKMILSR